MPTTRTQTRQITLQTEVKSTRIVITDLTIDPGFAIVKSLSDGTIISTEPVLMDGAAVGQTLAIAGLPQDVQDAVTTLRDWLNTQPPALEG